MTDLIDMAPKPHGPRTYTFDMSAEGKEQQWRLAMLVHSSMGVHELTKGLHLFFPGLVPTSTLNELRAIGMRNPDAAIASLRDMASIDDNIGSALDFILDRLIHFSGHTRDGLMKPAAVVQYVRLVP